MKKITYLKTITSLRGVSVLGVLLYHSKYSIFQKGYLGVDIFFVISGFLIGNIILHDLDNNQFKFISFYIRRLRRLLPALIVTIIFTTIVSYFIFLSEDFELFKNSIPYTLLFVGNIFFWKNNDYFSPSTDIMPLSHLWSLAIEEQFYFLFPFLIFLVFKVRFLKKNLKLIILTTITLSFIYSVSGFYNLPFDCPTTNCIEVTNFYWLHTRAWEILIGVLLNFTKIQDPIFRNSLLYVGLLIVVLSFIYTPSNLLHPGLGTLPSIIGTVMIILSSINNDTNFLSKFSIIYFLGKISYSLYLIHFPIFVIRNYFKLNLNVFNGFDILPIFLMFLSTTISFFMWKYVENPFRNHSFISNKTFLIILLASLFLLINLSNNITSKELDSEYEKFNFTTDFSVKKECFFEMVPDNLSKIDHCMNPLKGKENVLVIGSSIAKNIYSGLTKSIDSTNFDVVIITGCPPLVEKFEYDIINFSEDKCEVLYKQVIKNLFQKQYSKIIISYQWGELISYQINKDLTLFDYTLNNILKNVQRDRIIIVGQPVRWNIRLDVFAIRELNLKNNVESLTSQNFDKRIFANEEIIKKKLIELEIEYYSLIDRLCEENKCLVYKKINEIYYFVSKDIIHLSDYFSKEIGEDLFKKLKF